METDCAQSTSYDIFIQHVHDIFIQHVPPFIIWVNTDLK